MTTNPIRSVLAILAGLIIASNSYALACPTPNSTNFLHTVQPNVSGQPWQMDVNFIGQGWSIVDSPMADQSNASSISQLAPPLTVILTRLSANPISYTMTCQYNINNGGPIPIYVTVSSGRAMTFQHPNNRNFQKINSTDFACTTTANNTATCSEDEIHPVTCGLGQAC